MIVFPLKISACKVRSTHLEQALSTRIRVYFKRIFFRELVFPLDAPVLMTEPP